MGASTAVGSSCERDLEGSTGRSASFWLYFLIGLTGVSLTTNTALIFLLHNPSFVHQLLYPVKVLPNDHVRGSAASVTIVEYADFQCPFCAKVHPGLKRLAESGKIRWIYRSLPLNGHPLAEPAAEIAECSSEQGKFWDFADRMFAEQQNLASSADLRHLASEAGLNDSALIECLSSKRARSRVESEVALAGRDLVQSTPTLFINGRRREGAPDDAHFDEILLATR